MVPFLKLGTQGNAEPQSDGDDQLVPDDEKTGEIITTTDLADVPIANVNDSVGSHTLETTGTEKK